MKKPESALFKLASSIRRIILISILISVFSALASSAIASDEWLYSDSAKIQIDVHSSLNSYATSSDYLFDGLTVNLSFIAKNSDRQIASVKYDPMPVSLGDNAVFHTSNLGKFDFGYSAEIKTNNNVNKVKEKIVFPPKNEDIPSDLKAYTLPAERIDSDDQTIIRASSKIAEGEDDYFVVVDKMSDFVNKEVNYNLSTLFIKGTKEASWVLRNKEGVCSEITVLFIAMLRSVGIPARFVSGISYTNSPLFSYNFGPHAWAEVYYPRVGWVPYDITYGEFAYIDLGHIEMKKSVDATETSTSYSWKARNVKVDANEVKITGAILEKDNGRQDDVQIIASPYYSKVGFLSYNIIDAKVKNLHDYYISKKVKIAKTQDLVFFNQEEQIALKPNEERDIYFIIKTPHLDSGYYYSFPITIYTDQNETGKTVFESSDSGSVISEAQMQDAMSEFKKKLLDSKVGTASKKAAISCFKRSYYIDEVINLKCDVSNPGNYYLENLTACVNKECRTTNLGINRLAKMNFTLLPEEIGVERIPVRLSSNEFSQDDIMEFDIIEVPKISIISTENPANASFDDEFEISYTIQKKSSSDPKRISSEISIDGNKRILGINKLDDRFKINTRLKGSDLTKNSEITFKVSYEDDLGRKYVEEKDAEIRLNRLTFTQQIRIFINKIESYFNGLWN